MNYLLNDYDLSIAHGEARKAWRKSKYYFEQAGMELDDLISAGYEGLLHAQATHDPARAPLRPWEGLLARQYIYRELNRCQSGAATPTDLSDAHEDLTEEDYEWELTDEHSHIRDLVIEMAEDDSDISILFMRFLGQMSYNELGEVTGLSRSTLHRRINVAYSKVMRQYDRKE